eukprot:scaffold8556_cov286-Pinguiococcus_pyrenoidosus.AAC.6
MQGCRGPAPGDSAAFAERLLLCPEPRVGSGAGATSGGGGGSFPPGSVHGLRLVGDVGLNVG